MHVNHSCAECIFVHINIVQTFRIKNSKFRIGAILARTNESFEISMLCACSYHVPKHHSEGRAEFLCARGMSSDQKAIFFENRTQNRSKLRLYFPVYRVIAILVALRLETIRY
jgi:hypothetical protein